jgi:hypothetical protein
MKLIFKKSRYILLGILCLIFASCAKDEGATPKYNEENLVPLVVEFDNVMGDRAFQLNSEYTTFSDEKIKVSLLQYFISNIKLTTTSGEEFVVNQDSSYFLIKGGDAASKFAKVKVPEGDYAAITFTVGVDSLRNTMPVDKRTGVLDPAGSHDASGMYWQWNSGYIFFKMEGSSTASSAADQKFRYHIGGFGGYSAPTFNNIKVVSLDLRPGGIAKVRAGRQSNVHILVDIMKVFNGAYKLSVASHPTVMFSEFSINLANNFPEMFSHDHSHN